MAVARPLVLVCCSCVVRSWRNWRLGHHRVAEPAMHLIVDALLEPAPRMAIRAGAAQYSYTSWCVSALLPPSSLLDRCKQKPPSDTWRVGRLKVNSSLGLLSDGFGTRDIMSSRLPGFQGPFPPPLAMSSRLFACAGEHTSFPKRCQLHLCYLLLGPRRGHLGGFTPSRLARRRVDQWVDLPQERHPATHRETGEPGSPVSRSRRHCSMSEKAATD
jgi:hypothetical protein